MYLRLLFFSLPLGMIDVILMVHCGRFDSFLVRYKSSSWLNLGIILQLP